MLRIGRATMVSIMDFGAKADGVTDDSAALQKAVDAHDEVFLPHGTCEPRTPSDDGSALPFSLASVC